MTHAPFHLPQNAAIATLDGRVVLVVEDTQPLALLVAEVLEHAGMRVLGPVGTVPEALDALDERRPDAVLLDMSLCGVPAMPVAETLAFRGIPFLCTTAFTVGCHPRFPGNAPVLYKPFRGDRLLASMARLLAESPSTRLH